MLPIAVIVALATTLTYAYNVDEQWASIDDDIRSLTESLPIEYQIGQMLQLDINMFMTKDKKLNTTELAFAVDRFGVGSILNTPAAIAANVPTLSCSEWRQLVTDIQQIALKHGPKIPIIYGLDSVHGANFISEATLFPQQIGLAASFNRDLVRKSFEITAKDTRACGIPWAFSPILDIALQKAWPRVYETFGEDPYLAAEMGYQAVIGLQGAEKDDLSKSDKVAASLKHFVGYSNPRSGQDRTQAWIPDRVLRQYFLPSFRKAINAGAATVMETYGDVNGLPIVSSEFYLKTVLRDELGFKGMLVTDFDEINNMYWWHHVAQTPLNAVEIAMNKTTIDMSMSGSSYNFSSSAQDVVKSGSVNSDRIALSCARVLQLKKNLGLLSDPFPTKNSEQISSVGSEDDRRVALNLAQESVTLLKNSRSPHDHHHHVLPLSKKCRVFLAGPSSNSVALLNSGWTLHWQGAKDNEFKSGTTIKQGLLSHLDNPDRLFDFDGCSIDNCSGANRVEAVKSAKESDVIVVCLSERAYAEKPGNITDIELDHDQVELVRELHETGVPIVVVLTMGRPRLLGPVVEMASAVVHAYLPGSEGGQAIADVLFGAVNPSGRLPITWPKHTALQNLPYWHAFSSSDTYKVEFPFGVGLSYTLFEYSDLKLSSDVLTPETPLTIIVEVSNVGKHDGAETVMLFLNAEHRIVAPEVRLLKRFKKAFIPRQSKHLIQFEIFANDTEFYMGNDPKPMMESGLYTVQIGDKTAQFTFKADSNSEGLAFATATSSSQEDTVSGASSLWSLIWFVSGAVAGLPIWSFLNNRKRLFNSDSAFEYGLMHQS